MIGYSSDFQKAFWSLLEVYKAALDVWEDEDKTRQFLESPHILLNQKTPLSRALESKKGHTEVLVIIGKQNSNNRKFIIGYIKT